MQKCNFHLKNLKLSGKKLKNLKIKFKLHFFFRSI
jgi:hypothetical protein